ncbi:MAG: DMT family transporter [Bacteroidales bacterium]|jgi:transporter family protein|nr:DMT family transporter [Bacteroidales bacterium]
MWVILAFVAAFFNGCYDISKKMAVNNSAILPVLLLSTLFAFLLLSPAILVSYLYPDRIINTLFYAPALSIESHPYIFLRAAIIVSAWLFGYSAIKNLPITITGPVNATRPVMTLALAMMIFHEALNIYQWIGVFITMVSLFLLSSSSKKEGVKFSRNQWIVFAFLGALIGSLSELYEKFLMQQFDVVTVQFWTSVYQCLIITVVMLVAKVSHPKRKFNPGFKWSILFIALFLMLTDFAYLYALSCTGAMISIISLIRRSSVLVSFAGGIVFFKERNIKAKIIDLVLMIVGMFFLFLGAA